MLVSVVIPCFNAEKYIERCVRSVHDQSFRNLEVICINNNSSDNTEQKLIKLKEEYPELILVEEKNKGANYARNTGLNLAKGEWIQFLDADDYLKVNKIRHQIELAKNIPDEIGFIAGGSITVKKNNDQMVTLPSANLDLLAPFFGICGNTCSNLWRKEAINRVGGWNVSIKSSQEADLMMRLILGGWTYIVDSEPLTVIDQSADNRISDSSKMQLLKQYIDVRVGFLDQLKQKNSQVYQKNLAKINDFLMSVILDLASLDYLSAEKYFTNYIKPSWQSNGMYGISLWKRLFIKVFGLKYFLDVKRIAN